MAAPFSAPRMQASNAGKVTADGGSGPDEGDTND
jgi:hypothetical protein